MKRPTGRTDKNMTDLPDDIPSYDELAALFRRAAPEVQDEAARILLANTGEYVWTPNSGPQAAAYDRRADELFYGGQDGADLIRWLHEARKLAIVRGRATAAVNATVEIGRLLGLLPDKPGRPAFCRRCRR